MRFALGRAFQLIGLVFVGFGLVVGVLRADLHYEERMLFAGVAVFAVGWLLARPYKEG
jgi:hypothetical protein